jgi:hypothetical protein
VHRLRGACNDTVGACIKKVKIVARAINPFARAPWIKKNLKTMS